MKKSRCDVRRIALTAMIASGIPFATEVSAQTTMPPNLKALPATTFSLITNATSGVSTLRFSTTSWNKGAGAFQLEAGAVETGSGKQQVYQRIFNDDGSSVLHLAGYFEYHSEHGHFHFNDYALYTLQPVNAPGGYQLTGGKTTFCVMDTTKIDTSLPGAPAQAVYSTCGRSIQGMSVGWGDTYGSHLPGQELDFTGNAGGIYQLKIEVDPKKLLVESDKSDNMSCVLLEIKKPSTVTVLDSSGSCSTVQSITPSLALMGTSVGVEIKGHGFAQGMAVSFESGNGPRPVASNVVVIDANTMTATITVPYKKQPGKDPLWDLRVGTGGVLRNAFTVIR